MPCASHLAAGGFFASLWKTSTNSRPMIFALLGVGDALRVAQEFLASVDRNDLDAEIAGEHIHHHLAFVGAQQTVINKTQVSCSPIAR